MDQQLRMISLKPDSTLELTAIYELGTRCRLWLYDIEIEYCRNQISWLAHRGTVSENADTIDVVKRWKGEESRWIFVRDSSADESLARLIASDEAKYAYHRPPETGDGWPCADIAASGIDADKITELVTQIRAGDHDDIHSFLMVKDGRLVVEEYFAAGGSRRGAFVTKVFRERIHHLASTTKSVTSALVGIAIDRGYITNVEDPIYRYLPAYAPVFTEEKKRIRICDMLTMTPGFAWRQFGVSNERNDGMRMWQTEDVVGFVLKKPLEAEPGKSFNYSNGAPTVTGAILEAAVGMDVKEFAEQTLFRPLGINTYFWSSYPDGSLETDGGLALRPRDLARIGQVFLNQGVWSENRIISEQWVRESTRERLRFGPSGRWGYGYHWMQAESRVRDRVVQTLFVPGDGNQILAVFPQVALVVVFTAGNYGRDPKTDYARLFEDFVLPAVLN